MQVTAAKTGFAFPSGSIIVFFSVILFISCPYFN